MNTAVDHAYGLIESGTPRSAAETTSLDAPKSPSPKILTAGLVIALFAVIAALLVEANSGMSRQDTEVLDGHGKWGGYLAAPAQTNSQ